MRWAATSVVLAVLTWVVRLTMLDRAAGRRPASPTAPWPRPSGPGRRTPAPSAAGTRPAAVAARTAPAARTGRAPTASPTTASPTPAAAPAKAVPAPPAPAPTGATPWVAPEDDGSCPAGYPVKAKLRSGVYHLEGMAAYARTRPDRCYPSAEAAEAGGFRRALR